MSVVMVLLTASGCNKADDELKGVELATRGTQVEGAVEKPKYVSVGKNGSRTDKKLGFQFEKPQSGEEIAVFTIKDMGKIRIRLFPDEAPITVASFKSLIKSGYYDGIIFHRVINNFMIQGGDPTATGSGGQSAWGVDFEDEFNANLLNFRGSLSMANSGKHTNGSQFFINTCDTADISMDNIKSGYDMYVQYKKQYEEELKKQYGDEWLDVFNSMLQGSVADPNKVTQEVIDMYKQKGGNFHLDGAFSALGKGHSVFGQVFSEDMTIVDKIGKSEVNSSDRPVTDVVIEKAEIVIYK
ncbi:MAG: peptidylprolyl isomerase [Clostridia bacterium]|nr:peptidylprolyl isomerase [Clostridia bacterium]